MSRPLKNKPRRGLRPLLCSGLGAGCGRALWGALWMQPSSGRPGRSPVLEWHVVGAKHFCDKFLRVTGYGKADWAMGSLT